MKFTLHVGGITITCTDDGNKALPRPEAPAYIVTQFRDSGSLPATSELRRLLSLYARPDCQLESGLVELKEQFANDVEAWLNLERHLMAFGNSGGGIILFGLAGNHGRTGLNASLATLFDPINLMQKLKRHAPQAQMATAYIEFLQYRKLYGTLLIGRSSSISVFDKVGNAPADKGRQKAIFAPGVVYIRTEGASREARQVDIDRLVSERLNLSMSAFLARVERVAELPPSSELLARNPGSSRGYVLVAGGQGVPVTIAQDDSGAVQLAEVLAPEAPLSSLDAEVAGQLRQWHADGVHRVPRATLMRWYLGRATFSPMAGRAEFCFLSSLRDWGYPMYWASQMTRARLEEVLRRQFEAEAYPDNRVLIYVIGTFFFSRRAELLEDLGSYMPRELSNVVKRLVACDEVRSYLISGRLGAAGARIGPRYYDLEDVFGERQTIAVNLFEQLMASYREGNVPTNQRIIAHQLDMLVHGDLES